MRKHRCLVVSALVALVALVAAPPSAAADDAGPTATTDGSGQTYKFRDDPLQAAGLGPLGTRILVSRGAARATLIRPRTAFVVELLKTVERL